MTNKTRINAVPPMDLRRVFETAVGEIQQPESTNAARRTPIFHRAPAPSREQSEKRAMTDAALALAQLWKIAPHHAR